MFTKMLAANRNLARIIQDYSIMTFGLFLFAMAWELFIIPAQITGGGVTGVSAVVYYATGIPVSVTYLSINAVLVLIGIKVLGANFGMKTIYSIGILTAFFAIFENMVREPLVNDLFLSSVIGGMLSGAGLGVVFSRGGSTGGTDIIAMIVNKYRNVSPGRVIMLCDVIIIGSVFLVFKSVDKMVYGYVVMWVMSYGLDSFLSGANRSAQMFIVSKEYETIAEFINREAGRGVTILDGKGWYTKADSKVIMSVVRKKESGAIFRYIKQIDPDAFISMGSVMGVYGKGFDNIKL
ncbi:YitT family protein [Maribellus sp. YY47]|uniref:YitT family protein n=1 Tax=Maribellus sp. YY47 TaxID=2929486 RepID=UPI0020016ED8|nr:YitT family protein [Maribellus sp. YY47]MCK3685799.1 YitT family protein [Maribellus sp. YY47]